MPTESKIRQAELPPGEEELLAEIDRLQLEVERLNHKLIEERADQSVHEEVQTVVAEMRGDSNDDADEQPDGRILSDGRFVPTPITLSGEARDPEPGAPRVKLADIPFLDIDMDADMDVVMSAVMDAVMGESVTAEQAGTDEEVDTTYEFAPGDDSASAFDVFFNAPDPHLEKIRRFLLG